MHPAELAYYAKKAFALFPGGAEAASAPAFAAHYERRRRSRSPARAMLDRGIARGFAAWLPSRTFAVARKYGMDAQWERQALAIARERFVDPNDIALFRIERPEELDHYIRRFEDAGFNKIENYFNDADLTHKYSVKVSGGSSKNPDVVVINNLSGDKTKIEVKTTFGSNVDLGQGAAQFVGPENNNSILGFITCPLLLAITDSILIFPPRLLSACVAKYCFSIGVALKSDTI